MCQRAAKLAIRQNIADTVAGASSAEACHVIGKVHFDEALSFARKSVSEADVKKFENFRESLAARKG